AGSSADAGVTATYRNEGTRLHMTGVHRSLYDTGSPGSVTYLTPHDRVALHYSRLSAQLQTRSDAGHSFDAGLWGEENRYKYVDNGIWTPGTSRFTTDAVGTRLVGGYALGKAGRLSLGLDYLHSREKAHGTSVNQPDSINDIAGIFAEHRWEGSRLSVISGLRYDDYHGSLRSNKGIDMPRSSKSYGHVSWSTGATFWLTEWLGVKGSLGTAFVAPTAVNLAGDYVAYGWYHYLGNPDLRAETSLTGQGGLEFDWNGLHAEIMYFQTRYKDRINTMFDTVRNAYTWTNVPSQRLGGFDITAEWKGDLGGVTFAPYGHAEIFTKRHNPDNSTVSYVPHYSAVAGMGLGWKKLWLDVNARFTGTQWQTNPYTYALNKMGGFAVVNAKLTVHATDKLDLYCGVNNLTNREYAFTWGYPMPGRSVFGGFSVRF
ncbi:MAG: TonB-dependent receptor, partial [Mailhella sp.]|nr:TonB-dependent receptor [Mailhella sp.]